MTPTLVVLDFFSFLLLLFCVWRGINKFLKIFEKIRKINNHKKKKIKKKKK